MYHFLDKDFLKHTDFSQQNE